MLLEDDSNSTWVVDKTGMDYSNEQDMKKVQSKVKDDRKKIPAAEVSIKIKVSSDEKSSNDSVTPGAPAREDFEMPKSLFFIGSCWIVLAISMIAIGNHYDNGHNNQDRPRVTICLQIEGSIFLLLALTFPLIIGYLFVAKT